MSVGVFVKHAGTFATVQARVTACLSAMTRVAQVDDSGGVPSAGELVGDAVVNIAAFLKNGVPQ